MEMDVVENNDESEVKMIGGDMRCKDNTQCAMM
jgi:hypothetical protein